MAYSQEDLGASLAALDKSTENYLQNIDINTICAGVDKEDPITIAQDTFLKVYKSGVNEETHNTMVQLFCGLFPKLKLVKNFKKKILAIIIEEEYDFCNICLNIEWNFK
jgi:hypothetical protein